jgi:arginine-tRNA-protein transferase
MTYKARFRPAEVLSGGTWRMLTDADIARHDGIGASDPALVPESAN